MNSDEDLVRRLNEKDEEAFKELIVRYNWCIRRAAFRMLVIGMAPRVAEIEADDVIQEVCLTLYKRGIRGPIKNSLFRYLVGVARKKAWDLLPSIDARDEIEPLENVLTDRRPNPEAHTYAKELAESVRNEISQLPPKYRDVLSLYLQEMSEAEMSEELQIPPSTVKARLHQGREMLAKRLKVRK